MFHSSYIEISKSAYKNNLDFIKKLIGNDVVFSSVIKGNAYGHGIENMVQIAEECGVNHFSVFSADEALRTFKAAKNKPVIMIMGYIAADEIPWAVENDIEFFVFEMNRLKESVITAKKQKKKACIHLEIETGMNRTGFENGDLKILIPFLKENAKCLEIEGICTHYAGAEAIANYVRIQKQIKIFNETCKKFNEAGIYPKKRHTACSAATIAYPKTKMDMVRIGILQYGFWPSQETQISYLLHHKKIEDPLKRLISWKSRLMEIQHVKAGEFIGYGTSFLTSEKKKVGVVPVGYSNGYARALSNHGRVLVNGVRVQVIGVVNMNLLMVDLNNISNVKIGDEVVLIGKQGELSISVASFSELSNQLNYEMLSRIPEAIRREIID